MSVVGQQTLGSPLHHWLHSDSMIVRYQDSTARSRYYVCNYTVTCDNRRVCHQNFTLQYCGSARKKKAKHLQPEASLFYKPVANLPQTSD